jgi:hypothetical protein
MRAVAGILIASLAAACGGRAAPAGPAWPRSAGDAAPDSWEEDGGESLAPRRANLAAVERSTSAAAEPDDEADDVVEAEAAPAPADEEATEPPAPETTDLPELSDDEGIIIEIDLTP